MPSLSGEVILTHFGVHNEKIDFTNNKFIINKEPKVKKGNSLWREQIVSTLMPFSPFKAKREKAKLFITQERLYNNMNHSLRYDNTSFNKNPIKKQSLFIGSDVEYPRKLIKSWSSDTISDEYQSDSDSERTASGSYSSAECSSLSSTSSSEFGSISDLNESEKNEMILMIQRFGSGLPNRSSLPLALSLDYYFSQIKGITWETINEKADLVLQYWCSRSSRKVNRVLPNASDFVCPDPSLQNRMILNSKKNHKPLKRWNSYEDLYGLDRKRASTPTVSATDETLFSRQMLPKATAISKDCSLKERLNNTTKELTILKPISSPVVFDQSSPVRGSARLEPKGLLRNIRAPSPLSLALYLTQVDKHFFIQLKDYQLFDCMIGSDIDIKSKDSTELEDIFEFGSELNKFVVSIIRRQITPESQSRKIAGFIEVACALRKLRNWHSLVNVISALQSPRVFFMEEAWMTVKKTFPVHFSDYTKLCRLVRLNQTCIIGSTIGTGIPSVASLLSRITIHCIATWDLIEHKRRWTEQPSIAGWVDNELIGQLVESQKQREKQEERYMLSMESNKDSLLPDGDPIRLIPYSTLPVNWRQRDIKYMRQSYLKPIVRCFQSSFQKEIHSIRLYSIPTPFT